MRVEPSGRVFVATGLTTQGQGHQTTFAQIAAEALGCAPADVTVVTGDTGRVQLGRRHLREPRAGDERQCRSVTSARPRRCRPPS